MSVSPGSWDEAVLVALKQFGRVNKSDGTASRAKKVPNLMYFTHFNIYNIKAIFFPTTGGWWLLLELPLAHRDVAEKSLLIQRWVMSST